MKLYSYTYKIVPLSKELMIEATILMEAVFPYKKDQKGAKWSFNDSLMRQNSGKQYWLALNHNREVVGMTGLYHDYRDKNTAWLGWYGVNPQHRRHGLGSMLLEFAISEAEKRGFSVLKLYTSFNENESAAHFVYRKYDFIQIVSDKKADKIIFLKKLK
jgi:GNAT superfamily N-acetyltransferase